MERLAVGHRLAHNLAKAQEVDEKDDPLLVGRQLLLVGFLSIALPSLSAVIGFQGRIRSPTADVSVPWSN